MRNTYIALIMTISIFCISYASAGPTHLHMGSAQSGTKQGQARLYFLRETRVVFSARRAPIKIDDQEIGRLRNGAYFFVDVLPGKHQISIKMVRTSSLMSCQVNIRYQ
jgi:hypothetical protein